MGPLANWNQVVLGYTQERQRQLMRRVGIDNATWQHLATILFIVTGAIMLALAALMLHKLKTLRPDPVSAAYARFCERLARSGVARHPSEGPDAFRKRASAARPELAQALIRSSTPPRWRTVHAADALHYSAHSASGLAARVNVASQRTRGRQLYRIDRLAEAPYFEMQLDLVGIGVAHFRDLLSLGCSAFPSPATGCWV
jgi:hypothetical protein